MNRGYDPEFWPAYMLRDGCQATKDQMASAWKRWSGGNLRGLMIALHKEGAWRQSKNETYDRLADGMLQYAKRKGAAVFDKGIGSWVLTEHHQ